MKYHNIGKEKYTVASPSIGTTKHELWIYLWRGTFQNYLWNLNTWNLTDHNIAHTAHQKYLWIHSIESHSRQHDIETWQQMNPSFPTSGWKSSLFSKSSGYHSDHITKRYLKWTIHSNRKNRSKSQANLWLSSNKAIRSHPIPCVGHDIEHPFGCILPIYNQRPTPSFSTLYVRIKAQ